MLNIPDIFLLHFFIVSFLGLMAGSFSSALVYRIPRDIPWIIEKKNGKEPKACRSACPHCGYRLKFLDLIPFFSWLFLAGKCRSCKRKISVIYPLVELTVMTAFIAVLFFKGFAPGSIFIFVMIPFLVALLYIDMEHFILPDELVLICAALGIGHISLQIFLGSIPVQEALLFYIGGAFFYSLFLWGMGHLMEKLLKKEALGFGDVKLFFVVGLWLGLAKFSLFMLLTGVMGVAFALIWKLFRTEELFPFGPAIIVSFFSLLFFDGSHFF